MREMKIIQILIMAFFSLAVKSSQGQIYIADTNVCGNTAVWFKDTNSVPSGKTVVERQWDFDGVNKDTTTEDSVSFAFANTIAGNQLTVTLVVVYSDASTATFTKIVRVWALPIIDSFRVNRAITCPGFPLKFEAVSRAQPVSGAFLTNWSVKFGDGTDSALTSAINNNLFYTYNAMGVYSLTYTVTDDKKCVSKANLEVRIIKTPEVKFTPIQPRCKDSVILYENRTEGRDTTWTWQWTFLDSLYIKGSQGQDSFILFSVKQKNGTGKNFIDVTHIHPFYAKNAYAVLIGTNQHGCTDTSDIFISRVDTMPDLIFTPRADTTVCFGQSVQYTIRGSDTIFYGNFQWANRISGDSIVLFTPRNTITYKVYGKTPQCPPTSKDIKITVVQPVETNITTDPKYILRGAVSRMKLRTNGILDSLFWTPDSTLTRPRLDSTGAAPQVTTTYKVKLYYSLNNYVCSQEDSSTIFVNTDCQIDSLKIPTAFSPNGDDLNDKFYVKSFALKTILTFNVFNRWGNRVFNVENVPADDDKYYWNGKINNNGDDVPLGLYIYNISAVCKNDQILNFQGEITVLR